MIAQAAAKAAIDAYRDHSESEVADIIADLAAAERDLATFRRALLAELSGPVDGKAHRIVESRQAKRSYNTSGLLSAFGGYSALPTLVAQDVVRIEWQWTKLQRAAQQFDVTLIVAQHEIDDGDEALVGEVWSSRYTVEAK